MNTTLLLAFIDQALLAAGAVGLLVFAIFYLIYQKTGEMESSSNSALDALDEYIPEDMARTSERQQELAERSFADRVGGPVLGVVLRIGQRLTPHGYVEKTRNKLVLAGREETELDRFLVIRVATIAAIAPAYFLVFNIFALEGRMGMAVFGLLALLCILGPDSILNRQVEERSAEIRQALPDILDLLVISVEAGLGFEQALDRTIKAVPGPLSEEFERFLGETRAGMSRAEAMKDLASRIDVEELHSFILSFLQADAFGVSIARVLRTQAEEMRIKRKQMAEEKAAKAPIKMMIPMVFCVFPPLFAITIGPAIIQIMEGFA